MKSPGLHTYRISSPSDDRRHAEDSIDTQSIQPVSACSLPRPAQQEAGRTGQALQQRPASPGHVSVHYTMCLLWYGEHGTISMYYYRYYYWYTPDVLCAEYAAWGSRPGSMGQQQRSSQIPEQNARPHLPAASKHAGGACRFWPALLAPVCSPGPGCSIQRGWQDSPLQIIVPIDRAHAESPGSSTDPDPGGTPDGACEPVDLWACEQTESEEARRRGVSSTWCMVRIVPRTMVPGKPPPRPHHSRLSTLKKVSTGLLVGRWALLESMERAVDSCSLDSCAARVYYASGSSSCSLIRGLILYTFPPPSATSPLQLYYPDLHMPLGS